MNASLRALLTGLIDFAGLFPPAKLPMDVAVRNYLRYRDEPEAWMLGRFICPAARLHELAAFAAEIGDRPLVVSALGRGGETSEELLVTLEADRAEIAACRERLAGQVCIDTLEVKLPLSALTEVRLAGTLLEAMGEWSGKVNVALFFEVPWTQERAIRRLYHVLEYLPLPHTPGFKFRTGGLEASAFPSSAQVARVLEFNYITRALFKATAGLHHPLPRFDEGVQARMHGFINLFVAGMLLAPHDAPYDQIVPLLDDDRPENFTFTDGGLTWRTLHLSTEQIARARQERYISFGSCSFDEPRDDLRALGWL